MAEDLTSKNTTRSIGTVIVLFLIAIVVIVVLFLIVRGLSRLLGFRQPQVQPEAQALEVKEQIRLVSTNTHLYVEVLPPGDPTAVTLSQVARSPQDYLGQRVTVHGYVYRNVSGWGFEMSETLERNSVMLVLSLPQFLNDGQLEAPYRGNTPVKVTGTVKYFTEAEEDPLGLRHLESPLFIPIYDRHVIVAEEISRI